MNSNPGPDNQEKLLQQAKDAAFNLLSFRERSKSELADRLSRKGFDSSIIEVVIARLTELDYLNDRRFTEGWVRSRIRYKPRGRYLLFKELQAKGIDPTLANQVLDEMLTGDQELKLAVRSARKWMRSHQRETGEDREIKLKRYLQNKGFDLYLIELVFNRLEI